MNTVDTVAPAFIEMAHRIVCAEATKPVGYDLSIIPGRTNSESPEFGILRLTPHHLRVMPGTVLLQGQGETLTWRG